MWLTPYRRKLGFVVPKISAVFESSKATLPLITVMLIKASTAVRKGWWAMLLLGLGGAALWKRMMKREELLRKRDRLYLKLPLAGLIWRLGIRQYRSTGS